MCENISDKLVNHVVSEYILSSLDNTFIDTNVSTRINKGTKYAIDKFVKFSNNLLRENKKIYVLKIDIKKYYYNIDHEILKDKLCKAIKDKDALKILFQIIDSTNDSYINDKINVLKKSTILKIKDEKIKHEIASIPCYQYGKGLPIGNMTSQVLAIFYLSKVDHYIKEVLHHKYYIRYMDDLLIIDNDKNKLLDSLKKIIIKLCEEKLIVNKKTKLYSLSNTVNFLGYSFNIDNKLFIRGEKNTINRIKRHLNKIKNSDYPLYYKSIRSYKGYFKSCHVGKEYIIVEKNTNDKYSNVKKDYKDYIVLVKSGIFFLFL